MNSRVGFVRNKLIVFVAAITLSAASPMEWIGPVTAAENPSSRPPDGWTTTSPRDEIRPEFAYDSKGAADGSGCFVIKADQRQGLAGYWQNAVPVTGGKHYHFSARYQAKGVTVPRRSIVVEIH